MLRRQVRSRAAREYDSLTRYRERQFVASFQRVGGTLLGIGCSDGRLTLEVARQTAADRVIALDIQDTRSEQARNLTELLRCDLRSRFPLADGSVETVSADQVIEHMDDPDHFLAETFRVLAPGGQAVICTENLSAWHNIVALVLGWQAFAQHISSQATVGNPLALHEGEVHLAEYPRHVSLFTPRGLRELSERQGFEVERSQGMGHFPLTFSRPLDAVDATHSYFIAVTLRKPLT